MRLRNLQRWKRPQIDVTQPYYNEGSTPAPMSMKLEIDVVVDLNDWSATRGVPIDEARADFRAYVMAAYREMQAKMLDDGVFPAGSQIVG